MTNWLDKKKESYKQEMIRAYGGILSTAQIQASVDWNWNFIQTTLREFIEESRLDRATDGYFQDFERGYNQSLSDMEVRFEELLGEE